MFSEVARIKQEIYTICEAARLGLTGFAETAQHAHIEHKYAALKERWQELEQHTGAIQARHIVASIYMQVMDEE